MNNMVSGRNDDILDGILSWYRNLDQRYKTAFLTSLIVGLISYFLLIAHHPFHDHGIRLPWVNSYGEANYGRWFSHIWTPLFNNADIPVITPIISLVLIILSGMLACLSWIENRPRPNSHLSHC